MNKRVKYLLLTLLVIGSAAWLYWGLPLSSGETKTKKATGARASTLPSNIKTTESTSGKTKVNSDNPYSISKSKEPFSVLGAHMKITQYCRVHFDMSNTEYENTERALTALTKELGLLAEKNTESVNRDGNDKFRIKPYRADAVIALSKLNEELKAILGEQRSEAFMQGVNAMTAFGCLGANEVIIEFIDESITGNSPYISADVKEYDARTGAFLQGIKCDPSVVVTKYGIPFRVIDKN